MKAQLFLDFSFAFLIWILIFAGLTSAFFLSLNSQTKQIALIESQKNAIRIADQLMLNCPEDYGLAKCNKGKVLQNEFSNEGIALFSGIGVLDDFKKILFLKKDAISISLAPLEGRALVNISNKRKFSGNICISRLGIFENDAVVLRVCVS